MKTEVIRVDRKHMDMQVIERAGKILLNGGLVAFPTETVYGLGANALDEEAAGRIYAAKGRPSDNPLIVHIADMEYLDRIVKKIPKAAWKLAEHYWPGPLTMIFDKEDCVPYGTTGGLDTVAVRMPSDIVARELIRQGGGYVAAPSANASGRPSPTTARHVLEDMDGIIPLILDGGPSDIGLESTIVDLTEETPAILRPGYISFQMVQAVLGKAEMDKGLIASDSRLPPKAPGMKYRHYAPKADLKIVEGSADQVVGYINEKIKQALQTGRASRIGIICTEETEGRYPRGNVKCIGSQRNTRVIASRLFGILREFDDDRAETIYSESFQESGLGQAIMNRLLKAAGHQVIDVSEKS